MRFYAEDPRRLARQVTGDVLVVGWVLLCGWLADAAHAVVLRLAQPGLRLADSGDAIRDAFRDAAATAAGIPFIGGDLARSLGGGARAGDSLVAAGQDQLATVGTLATTTAVAIVLLGALPVAACRVLLRVRYARAAGSAAAIRDVDGGELLALRALAHQPVRRLIRVSPNPAATWRSGDPAGIRSLAELELRSLGLRPGRD